MLTELIRALAAQHALLEGDGTANPAEFIKRANDAYCVIESFATGTLDVKIDHYGGSRFCLKSVEPNTDAATAKDQPVIVTDDCEERYDALLAGDRKIVADTILDNAMDALFDARTDDIDRITRLEKKIDLLRTEFPARVLKAVRAAQKAGTV